MTISSLDKEANSTSNDEPFDPYRRQLLKASAVAAVAASGFSGVLNAATSFGPGEGLKGYQVNWHPDHLCQLRSKIKNFKFPSSIPNSEWKFGADPDYLRALIDHWSENFDMEGAEQNLNRFPQYITRVEDLDIHFIRVIGEGGPNKARLPLLCTHGWPGSVFEFWESIERLAYPSRYGNATEIAFDLIIPSLPGHGSSGKPSHPIGARTTARLWNKLMRDNLGYTNYYAQGGDWGAGVTAWLALDYPEAVKAIHLNLMIAAPQSPPETQEEQKFFNDAAKDEQRWGAYYQLQATDPQSLAYAMNDNPVAQAAWLIQRFYQWSDKRTKTFDQVFTMDQLLTNTMIYVMNNAFQTSTWFYTGSELEGVKHIPLGKRIEVPTGFASYSGDSRSPTPPRSIVEKGYNIRHWYDVAQGGHFAAMEVPELYVQGLQGWAKKLQL